MNKFIDWATANWWRVAVIWLIAITVIIISWHAFAEGRNGTSNDGKSWGERSTRAELNYRRGVGIWGMVSPLAVPAWNYAKQFHAYVNQEGPLAMDRSGIQHANDGSRMIGGHVVGDDGHIVGGI